MGLENPLHIAFLVLLLLLVFGAKRLPEAGRSLGAGLRGFRDSLAGEPSTRVDAMRLPGGPGAAALAAGTAEPAPLGAEGPRAEPGRPLG
jgi:sec-independent protein translocase protein TatA